MAGPTIIDDLTQSNARTALDVYSTSKVDALTGPPSTVSLNDGSAASPSMYFSGDSDTGIYRIGDDDLAITVGGTILSRFSELGASGNNIYLNGGTLDTANNNDYFVKFEVTLNAALDIGGNTYHGLWFDYTDTDPGDWETNVYFADWYVSGVPKVQINTNGWMGLGGFKIDNYPITAYQSDDAKGIRLKGYDDKSADYIGLYVDSSGNGFIEASSSVNIPVASTFGDGGTTNYAAFATDGEITLNGTARVAKYIQFAGAIFEIGATAPNLTTLGDYVISEYTINDDSSINFDLPKDWASGTDITIYLDWGINRDYATESAEVQWNIGWSATPHDASEALDSPIHSGTLDPGDQNIPTNAKTLTTTTMGTISNSNLSADDQIGLSISRVALDDGTDPGGGVEPFIVHLEVKYISNKLGEAT